MTSPGCHPFYSSTWTGKAWVPVGPDDVLPLPFGFCCLALLLFLTRLPSEVLHLRPSGGGVGLLFSAAPGSGRFALLLLLLFVLVFRLLGCGGR